MTIVGAYPRVSPRLARAYTGVRPYDCQFVHIVCHDSGTVVFAFQPQGDVAQGDIVGMSDIESPGGQLLPHRELGVASLPFGYGCQLLGRAAPIGVGAVGMAGIGEYDILQQHILYAVSRSAHDARGRHIAGQILHRSLVAVACVGLVEWHLYLHVANHNVLKAGGALPLTAFGETQEEGIARVGGAEAVNLYVFHRSTVDAGNGDGAAVGVAQHDVAEAEVAELAARHSAELDAVG